MTGQWLFWVFVSPPRTVDWEGSVEWELNILVVAHAQFDKRPYCTYSHLQYCVTRSVFYNLVLFFLFSLNFLCCWCCCGHGSPFSEYVCGSRAAQQVAQQRDGKIQPREAPSIMGTQKIRAECGPLEWPAGGCYPRSSCTPSGPLFGRVKMGLSIFWLMLVFIL
jgi:hypothetical protein